MIFCLFPTQSESPFGFSVRRAHWNFLRFCRIFDRWCFSPFRSKSRLARFCVLNVSPRVIGLSQNAHFVLFLLPWRRYSGHHLSPGRYRRRSNPPPFCSEPDLEGADDVSSQDRVRCSRFTFPTYSLSSSFLSRNFSSANLGALWRRYLCAEHAMCRCHTGCHVASGRGLGSCIIGGLPVSRQVWHHPQRFA